MCIYIKNPFPDLLAWIIVLITAQIVTIKSYYFSKMWKMWKVAHMGLLGNYFLKKIYSKMNYI